MRCSGVLALAAVSALLLGTCGTVEAAMITATDDTILLNNGGDGDAEDNFGGRTELIVGNSNGNPRDGLVRFDVSSLATEINAGLDLSKATLTLYERSGRNGIQPAGPTTFSVEPLVAGNAGWVEGTKTGSSAGLSGEQGSVSRLYLSTPSSATSGGGANNDGLIWFSAGGGATDGTNATQFAPGTDTDPALGTADLTSDGTNDNETWEIDLDLAAMKALLPSWLADPTGNPGLAIVTTGGQGGQWFFGSVESGAGTDPAASLHLQFVPEPSSFLMIGMAGLGLAAVRMRYRLG